MYKRTKKLKIMFITHDLNYGGCKEAGCGYFKELGQIKVSGFCMCVKKPDI